MLRERKPRAKAETSVHGPLCHGNVSMPGPLPDYSFKGDESGKDDHDDPSEGNAKKDIVHGTVFP